MRVKWKVLLVHLEDYAGAVVKKFQFSPKLRNCFLAGSLKTLSVDI